MAGIQQAGGKAIGTAGAVRKAAGFDWEGAMAASLAGDSAAYRRLLEEAGRWLRRYFARRLSPELIDDAVQEALTALHLNGEEVELLHIGDSRCYQWRGKKLVQLSYDHTVMQELLDQGRLTAEEVINHPQRSLLTQALIGDSGIDPILHIYESKIGDQFLLCSDGLSSVLSDYEIATIIKKSDPSAVVDQLIDAVHDKGAPDNVTILWVEVVADEGETHVELLGAAK